MCNHLFVYGTLAPGQPNEHILAPLAGCWRNASVSGALLDEGWGAEMGYPGLLLTQSQASGSEHAEQVVEGQVFSSDALPQHWQRLDEFEGEAYQRTLTQVRLQDGTSMTAYVYALRPHP